MKKRFLMKTFIFVFGRNPENISICSLECPEYQMGKGCWTLTSCNEQNHTETIANQPQPKEALQANRVYTNKIL